MYFSIVQKVAGDRRVSGISSGGVWCIYVDGRQTTVDVCVVNSVHCNCYIIVDIFIRVNNIFKLTFLVQKVFIKMANLCFICDKELSVESECVPVKAKGIANFINSSSKD